MAIRERSIYPIVQPISGKFFVTWRVPGGEREPPDQEKAQSQSAEQGRKQMSVNAFKDH